MLFNPRSFEERGVKLKTELIHHIDALHCLRVLSQTERYPSLMKKEGGGSVIKALHNCQIPL